MNVHTLHTLIVLNIRTKEIDQDVRHLLPLARIGYNLLNILATPTTNF